MDCLVELGCRLLEEAGLDVSANPKTSSLENNHADMPIVLQLLLRHLVQYGLHIVKFEGD